MTTTTINDRKGRFERLRVSLSSGLMGAAIWAAASSPASAQTPYFLSSGDFSENFADIADTTAWPNGFLSSEPWAPVAVNTTGDPIPSATRVTTSTASILAENSTAGGIQRGVENIYLLSTGGGAGNTSSSAVDLLLSFTNRNAGNLSFNAATVFNGTGNRNGTLRVYYTTDNSIWTEFTGGGLPFTATNNLSGSQAVSLALPAALNEAPSARLRFYYHNSPTVPETTPATSGSRPKISIDNVLVTSTTAGPDNTAPTLVSLSPANAAGAAAITSPLTINFSEPVVAGAGNVTLYAASQPSTPLQTFPASAGAFSNTSVSFTPTSALAYSTGYFVVVDANAFRDAATNPFAGIPSGQWTFTTEAEPLPIPPLVVRLSPESNATPAVAGNLTLEIEYDQNVVRGSGSLRVFDLFGDGLTPEASYDISSLTDVTIAGGVVSFVVPFTGVADGSYYVQAPAGLLRSVVGSTASEAIGLGGNDVQWFFDVVAPDTAPPFVATTSPQNGAGASVSPNLVATFNEPVTLATEPWTIEVFDITANQVFATFTQASATGVVATGNQLFLTLPSGLAFTNEYRVTLTAGVVKDAAGNLSTAVTGDAWRFTTGGPFVAGQVVISQVYGGGGNTSAPFLNDYVELYNKSASPISLSGWSLQYASSAGTSWTVSNLDGVIQPGGYFLAQQSAGTATNIPPSAPLPTPDSVGTLGMSGTSGKMALSNSRTPLIGANPSTDPTVSDLVGYGTADGFEGSGAAPILTNTTAAIRKVAGSQDTNNNAADFTAGPPAPRNSASPAFVPGADGSGIAVASNATVGAGGLIGSKIFPSMGSAQSVKIDLTGSFPGATITSLQIDVPSDFGTPTTGNIALSGAGGGVASASGQTVSINGVSVTETTTLSVVISGLTAPNISTVPSDAGDRVFTLRSAASGGTLTQLVSSPAVKVAMTVTDLQTLRAVVLPSTKAYILASQPVVTYLADGGFRNQHWIQDSTAGILIDDQSITLGKTFAVGDGLSGLVGTVSEFRGLLQFTPIAATASVSSMNNAPVPIDVTLAQLAAAPLTYQSRLVKVTGVTFNPATGNFANNSEHVLNQSGNAFGFSSFFGADYTATAVPTATGDIVGLVRRLSTTPTDFLSPRSLADMIFAAPPGSTFGTWSSQFAGGQAPNLDFDGDGVPNGVEYFFGVAAAGFTPTPGIVNRVITFPRDPAVTDATFVVQTSTNLVNWNPVDQANLDLTATDSIKYTIPNGTGPFFVRIRVDVTLPAP